MAGMYFRRQSGEVLGPMDLESWTQLDREAEASPEGNSRSIEDTTVGTLRVSTVFLMSDHNHGRGGPPILFETMVFRDGSYGDDIGCDRYTTEEEARAGHKVAVAWATHRHKISQASIRLSEGTATDADRVLIAETELGRSPTWDGAYSTTL